MPVNGQTAIDVPTRVQVDAFEGPAVLEFGASWCGFCAGARTAIDTVLAEHPNVRHLRIEDGRGQPLGRSYHVKLWPTLVFLRDGVEHTRLVRPDGAASIRAAIAGIDAAPRPTDTPP